MTAMRGSLKRQDRLMLSVVTMGPYWSEMADPLGDQASFSAGVRRFIALGRPTSDAVEGPDGTTREINDLATRSGASDVPGAVTFEVFDPAHGETIVSMRRYSWPALVSWMRDRLGLIVHYEAEEPINDIEGVGVAIVGTR